MRKSQRSIKKIEQNKAQYDLDKQTAKISALSSEKVGKYEFLTGKEVLPEKGLLEKLQQLKDVDIRSELKNKLTL